MGVDLDRVASCGYCETVVRVDSPPAPSRWPIAHSAAFLALRGVGPPRKFRRVAFVETSESGHGRCLFEAFGLSNRGCLLKAFELFGCWCLFEAVELRCGRCSGDGRCGFDRGCTRDR